jgi:hypothetical protein
MLRSQRTWIIAASWLVSFGVALGWLSQLVMLFDSDSYYHLAVARQYARHGILMDMPWARMSVMHHGFGDKELLFHGLLAPFAAWPDPLIGGKVALALLTASIIASVALSACDALGIAGLWLPAFLLCGSIAFDLRLIRLRPELLALLLLLWTVRGLTQRRYLLAGVLSLAFALAYTAIHALLGAVCLCFACAYFLDRKPNLWLLGWPVLGAVLGLLLHPHFPHNLRISYVQNVLFWRFTDHADVGSEIQALGLLRWLRFDWPLLLGVAALALSLERRTAFVASGEAERTRASAWFYAAVALPFCAAFVHSGRFALYALPFALLALAWCARLHAWQPGARLWRLGTAAPRSWLVYALVLMVAALLTAAEITRQADRGGCVWPAQRSQLERFGRMLPAGARVAAPWTATDDYVFFAPQGRYLNVLDPIFMRVAHPEAYQVQRRLFDGQVLDAALAVVGTLDSEYLAFPAPSHPALLEQVSVDPRFLALIAGGQALYRVVPPEPGRFVLDYRTGATRELAHSAAASTHARASAARTRAFEVFVEVPASPSTQPCQWFVPVEQPPHAQAYEFAASVAANVWVANQPPLRVIGRSRLLLGHGERFSLSAGFAGAPLSIEICSPQPAAFYLQRVGASVDR